LADYLLAIDQGTTSTRAIVFDAALVPVAIAQQEITQIYPAPGLVEHDPEEIWATTIATVRDAMAKANVTARQVAAIGITNQRETVIVWDRATGRRSTMPSCGKTGARRRSARSCAPAA
jgi:glycerol kinase